MPKTTAKIIADSISPDGYRITTFEAYYPRYILAEVNTHRVIAKSSASSRAIPLKKRIEQVRNDPFIPEVFLENQSGMQAAGPLDAMRGNMARIQWIHAAKDAAWRAEKLADLNVSKQQANRILEPYVFVHTVLTSTEWDNYFALRAHADADPEFERLASMMKTLYFSSQPTPLDHGAWHIPYIDNAERTDDLVADLEVSAARCARVSYKTHDGIKSTVDKDRELAQRLLASGHLSPFDHQGVALSLDGQSMSPFEFVERQRHFVGWSPFRVFVEEQRGLVCRRFARQH